MPGAKQGILTNIFVSLGAVSLFIKRHIWVDTLLDKQPMSNIRI
jgi:hypothetical protein